MFKQLFVMAAVLAVAATASAGEYVGHYDAPTTPFVSFSLTGGVANVGGVNFEEVTGTPVFAEAIDASGAPISFTVCQDLDASGICDETEPSALGCGEADLSTSIVPFQADTPVNVFVVLVSPDCGGVATTGDIILTTA